MAQPNPFNAFALEHPNAGLMMDRDEMDQFIASTGLDPSPIVIPMPQFDFEVACREIADLSSDPESRFVACLERERKAITQLNNSVVTRTAASQCAGTGRSQGSYTAMLQCLQRLNAIQRPSSSR